MTNHVEKSGNRGNAWSAQWPVKNTIAMKNIERPCGFGIIGRLLDPASLLSSDSPSMPRRFFKRLSRQRHRVKDYWAMRPFKGLLEDPAYWTLHRHNVT